MVTKLIWSGPVMPASINLCADDLKDDGLRWRMFRHARMMRGLAVQAFLNPARQEIVSSGQPGRLEILTLVRYSPWIPPGHMESFL